MAKVKISDVAREAGVSLGTVSNALNHPEKLRPETLKLINETINRLGYLPNQSARQLAGGATKSFGLVLPRLDHGFSLQIASGAHNEARKHGYDLLIANADNDDILEDHYLRYFMGTQMSGVMVQPMASPDWHPAMTKMPVPIVHLDIHCSEPGYYVAADNEAQGRIIAELAITRGARHITVVGRAAFMQLTLRVLGIHKALVLHPDIKIEVIDAGERNTAADGYSIGAQIAERSTGERPDFVIGLTDVLASGVISALTDKGISVPEQVRVAGCDGNPLAWSGSVPLTTVAPPGYEIGRKGVQLLMEQIENKAPAKTKHIRIGSAEPLLRSQPPRTSTVRNSCGRSSWSAPVPRRAAKPKPPPSTSARIYSTSASMPKRRLSKRGPTIAGPLLLKRKRGQSLASTPQLSSARP